MFVGTSSVVAESSSSSSWAELQTINCKDINDPQSFDIDYLPVAGDLIVVKKLKILFTESTDFYGRITIYNVDINKL